MSNLKEACGVVACYQLNAGHSDSNVYPYVVQALLNLQNRGQVSAGITTFAPDRDRILLTHKAVGTVSQVFSLDRSDEGQKLASINKGIAAIGHNRYATSGDDGLDNAQPLERLHGRMWKWFSIAFNGNLVNYTSLKKELESHGYHITFHSDTEIMMHCINREMRGDTPPDLQKMCANLSQTFEGAYNLVFLNAEGTLIAMRDPDGFRPLCYGEKGGLLVVASEDVVHQSLQIDEVVTLQPGEVLIAKPQGYQVMRYAEKKAKKNHCFFEWTYLANLPSTIEDRSVYGVRQEMGRLLAEQEHEKGEVKGEMVVAVPETANTVAKSFAYHMGLPVVEGLVRNRYLGRSFIEKGDHRHAIVDMKFTPMTQVLRDKKIYLVDDTIVRGTTLAKVVEGIKKRGKAAEVHVRIGCPPVQGPCYYGIDMNNPKELFAPAFFDAQHTSNNGNGKGGIASLLLAQMAEQLGADSLDYLALQALVKAIGLSADALCLACLNLDYPTPTGRKLYEQVRLMR